jgi:hypothetical protein
MRRCPQCQSPNTDSAPYCSACWTDLPPPPRAKPWAGPVDVWDGPLLRRVALGQIPLLLFALSCGRLLTVGDLRQEWHFAVFHLLHGLILGAGLAWAWREKPRGWAAWMAAGLGGGLLAEALDAWYTYHGVMGFLTMAVWQWFGMADDPALYYEILQIMRLAAPGLVLWAAVYCQKRGSTPARRALAFGWIVLALAVRSQVRGAWVAWPALLSLDGWIHLGLYAVSTLALAWGLGPRGLTREPEIH